MQYTVILGTSVITATDMNPGNGNYTSILLYASLLVGHNDVKLSSAYYRLRSFVVKMVVISTIIYTEGFIWEFNA